MEIMTSKNKQNMNFSRKKSIKKYFIYILSYEVKRFHKKTYINCILWYSLGLFFIWTDYVSACAQWPVWASFNDFFF